ncbi:hypothetical protein [Methylobacterium isbiliense]|uniref:DUF2946 domain-containing protein n=1 Tax=Methylobacterium isbiliense TaxID=315478 RepID=A0ABQ4SIF8_9HYPH|nr:hypothetical protein [Methylobacterium isbiliense]MDN3626181.1 hypothetical protein [Methylobacterium isbiliense]GJE02969.1 hypothetical protein GMJLKIPL_4919 [Methylobacterium isbiliense]
MLVIYGRFRAFIVYVAAAAISVALFAGQAHAMTPVAAATVASASPENRPLAHHHTVASKHATRSCCPLCASAWLVASAPEVPSPLRAAGPTIWPQDRRASELNPVDIFRPPKGYAIS